MKRGRFYFLTWNLVSNASSYNLYRRAENEATAAKIKAGISGSPVQDTPTSEGRYYYSLSSSGLLGSESARSGEVPAISDRTGPGAPSNLSLSFSGSGVTAVWDAPPPNIPPYQGGTGGGYNI